MLTSKPTLSTPAKKIIYMTLFAEGQRIIDRYDPCQIKDGECAAGPGMLKACCHGCQHLGPKGCTVQALTCKLHLCGSLTHYSATRNRHEVREANAALSALTGVAIQSGLMHSGYTNMRRSFEEIFDA